MALFEIKHGTVCLTTKHIPLVVHTYHIFEFLLAIKKNIYNQKKITIGLHLKFISPIVFFAKKQFRKNTEDINSFVESLRCTC